MTQRKWFLPFFYILLFSLCSGMGATWGVMVRTPHPPIDGAPLYPKAEAIINVSATRVAASLTPISTGKVPRTSFEYTTTESPEAVITFYRDLMRNTYGFIGDTTESTPDTTFLRFMRRALRDAWVYETVIVRITSEGGGVTKVNVDLETRPVPPWP